MRIPKNDERELAFYRVPASYAISRLIILFTGFFVFGLFSIPGLADDVGLPGKVMAVIMAVCSLTCVACFAMHIIYRNSSCLQITDSYLLERHPLSTFQLDYSEIRAANLVDGDVTVTRMEGRIYTISAEFFATKEDAMKVVEIIRLHLHRA